MSYIHIQDNDFLLRNFVFFMYSHRITFKKIDGFEYVNCYA